MEQYQYWQGLPGSRTDTQAPTMEPSWNKNRIASGTTSLTTNSEHSNGQRTSHTNVNRTQASLSRSTDQVTLTSISTISTVGNNSVLGESSRSIPVSLDQQMNNIGQISSTGGSLAAGISRVHTAAELEAERVCNVILNSYVFSDAT